MRLFPAWDGEESFDVAVVPGQRHASRVWLRLEATLQCAKSGAFIQTVGSTVELLEHPGWELSALLGVDHGQGIMSRPEDITLGCSPTLLPLCSAWDYRAVRPLITRGEICVDCILVKAIDTNGSS